MGYIIAFGLGYLFATTQIQTIILLAIIAIILIKVLGS
jgi:hypothetical protein